MQRDACAAPFGRRERGERRARGLDIGAERLHAGEDAEHVHGDVAARHADAAREALAEDVDHGIRAALVFLERGEANVGLFRSAESDDAPGRARQRMGFQPF